MSTIISTATYKNFQVIISEITVNQYEYKIDNPFNANTVKCHHGYTNSTDAGIAAHAYIDAMDVNQAQPVIATALSGNNTEANAVILALLTAGYNIGLDVHVTGGDNNGFTFGGDRD